MIVRAPRGRLRGSSARAASLAEHQDQIKTSASGRSTEMQFRVWGSPMEINQESSARGSLPEEFVLDGISDGVPYRFGIDGSIDAVIRGRLVHFGNLDAFVTTLARPRRLSLILLVVHVALICTSLYYVQKYYSYIWSIAFDPALLPKAGLSVALFSVVLLPLFSVSRFSFGYYLGFYFLNMILGYVWLVQFSIFDYSTSLALISILLSAVAFLLPSLFLTSKLPDRPAISDVSFDRLLSLCLICSAAVLVVGMIHHFRIVDIHEIYDFRNQIEFPPVLRYAIGMTVGAVLPFAFAGLIARRRLLLAVTALAMLLLFYPVTLTKVALFAPIWLLFLLMLSMLFKAPRTAVVLSALLPLSGGIVSVFLVKVGLLSATPMNLLFSVVNFRMLAMPSLALDFYNDFFSHHPLTHFCQVSLTSLLMSCPYSRPLATVMEETYRFGSLNASLFATEGIASIGTMAAPLSALVCGLVISVANGAASRLPARFVLLSSGVVLQSFINVPLTTTMLTNGAGLLFLLWYITPRSIFAGD
jgi:hypothetical protein